MHPGTPHFVVSVEDCLAVGGHFYSAPLFDKTMKALVIEHFIGHVVTNTGHSQCGIVLLKMMSYTKLLIERLQAWEGIEGGMDESRGHGSAWIPYEEEIAYLIVIICYLDQLDPMEYVEKTGENNGTKKTSDEEERDFYYPNGDILTHEKHTDVLHVNMSKVPEIWQHTSAGRRDIFYTVSVIIENYLLRCSCSRDMLGYILQAELELLEWSKVLTVASLSSREITKSTTLSRLCSELNRSFDKPHHFDLECRTPSKVVEEYFKDLVKMGGTETKRKNGGATGGNENAKKAKRA